MRYKVLEDQMSGLKAGTIVEMFHGPSYGLATDDTMNTGIPHVCVIEEDSPGPFYTCIEDDLE
tara:strand:- start:528 stop:716 length:189 start_codon:yes stop_codon:yes gene_type:complete